ncbi:MAG TPA: cysteine desulfurase family protein, partial [Nitrososphaeraceae archaeon]|nr:cysteine desulfurase family protein [Nitrososphaeraceae archaeon]
KSKIAIQLARKKVAMLIGAKPSEIYFTSGGTEADNLAIKGICKSIFLNQKKKNHIITTSIEHEAILQTCQNLEEEGFDVSYLKVDRKGRIDINDLKTCLNEKTSLVSIMLANNEIGTVQPIRELCKIVHNFDEKIIFHSDAVQAAGKLKINVKELDIDALSLSSHKINGPKGIGALYVRNQVKFEPILHGGGQEMNLRSGTENVHGIVGFGKACELSLRNLKQNSQYMSYLRDFLIEKIKKEIPNTKLNGPLEDRLPNNVNFTFFGINGEDLLIKLNEYGVLASTGSACSTNLQKESHVLKAIGLEYEDISGSIRFSLGIQNTVEEVEKTVIILKNSISQLSKVSPLKQKYNL